MDEDAHGEKQTWRALRAGDTEAREQLIVRYLPLVRYVAWRVAARGVGGVVERDDLISYGTFGLIDAVDRFDPDRGVDFKHFAITRISGAIIDEIRCLDWAPRSVRSRVRRLQTAVEEFEADHLRAPGTAELADRLGWSSAEVSAVRREADDTQLLPLVAPSADEDAPGAERTRRHGPDHTAEDPLLNIEVDGTRRLLAEAVTMLPVRERAVAAMYWRGGTCPACGGGQGPCARCGGAGSVSGLTLGEISRVLGVSQSWACELYTNAALMLRENLAMLR